MKRSDEEFCLQCSLDQFECLVKGTNQCVSESLRCDGFETCDNGEDEFGCPGQCNGPLNYLCPETNCCISAGIAKQFKGVLLDSPLFEMFQPAYAKLKITAIASTLSRITITARMKDKQSEKSELVLTL